MTFTEVSAMFRSTVSILLVLSCCLVAIEATLRLGPPHIDCIDGLQDLHGFPGLRAAKEECYKTLANLKNEVARRGRKIRNVTPWEQGANDSVPHLPESYFYYAESPNCAIEVQTRFNELPDRGTRLNFGAWYSYYWRHVSISVKQVIKECFPRALEHGTGEAVPAQVRLIGDGHTSIELDEDNSVDSTVTVWYYGDAGHHSD